jgi:signal transduction histidine kinase
MWGLTALLLVLQGLAIVLLYFPVDHGPVASSLLPETRGILATSLFGLTVLFCLYVFDKQLEIRRLRSALEAERLQLESVRSRLSELSALFEVAAQMNTRLAPRAYLEAVMDRLVVALKAEGACVSTFDAGCGELRCDAMVGMDHGLAACASSSGGEGITGWVAENLEPLVLEREEFEARFPRVLASDSAILSVICVPLAVGGQPTGTLLLWRTIGNWLFSYKDASLLMLFGEHVAKDLRRLSELEELDQKASRLEGANRKLSELHEMKRVFLSTVKNEIRAPLAGVSYHAELLSRGDASLDSGRRQECLGALSDQVVHLAEFVNEITDLLALEAGARTLNLTSAQLNEIISDSVLSCTPTAAQKGVMILTELEGELPTVSLDEGKFSRAIQYLLSHAVRSSEKDGTIRVTTRPGRTDSGETIAAVEIADDEQRDRSGEPSEVHGLGLYLVKQLVELHGGRLWSVGDFRLGFHLPTRAFDAADGEQASGSDHPEDLAA